MKPMSPTVLRRIFSALLKAHGPQHWWPGDSPFEVMVGTVLTQNTAWRNVERAIDLLRRHDALAPRAILAADPARLAQWLRPSGCCNVKTRRLRASCAWRLEQGALAGLSKLATPELRQSLLSVNGVGPETADAMLSYAFDRPVFVIDAHARRLFSRLGRIVGDEPCETLRHTLEQAWGADAAQWGECHALIVAHGKQACRTRPRCAHCCLVRDCPAAAP